ncbi:PP2C family protein-serine/threonine phosphatase [Streptomyces sp. MBT33]|uniref:PP2C family protein-serine/threonine phosphatase n=1 Tax=Streptomyces sp. MBT33 TaxID=1488363 RepID=UPI001909957D|nr:PP2C family protein-serine/threonine phosphatase [Streptomyces sp. MBT33]MBK3641087.1 serine/threonine-protein phosphatase [Streptomyces sp. MBT33]
MTEATDIRRIASAADAARARTAVDRITTDGGAPALRRVRFLTALTARLRHCLDRGGEWRLLLRVEQDTTAEGARLHASLSAAGSPAPDPAEAHALTCPLPDPPAHAGRRAAMPLAEALLRADEDTAAVLSLLDAQETLLQLHGEELHQTNQGVLALHSDLEAAAHTQRALLEAEQSARAEAERARRLLTFLGDASAAIASSLSRTAILRRLSDILVPAYAEHLDVWLFDEEEDEDRGDDEHARPVREHSAAAVAAARTGRPQCATANLGALPGVDGLPPSALSPRRPLLAVPLTAHRLLGVLTLTAPASGFDADTAVMLVELARRVGVALDNARHYERYRDTAEALQRAQLTELPAPPGLLLAARYLPATWGMNIGGDWYDAFLQPDGSLLAVIGDVTGHGLRAAVVMGQLRTALRAYAVENATPGEILTRLHHMLRHLQPKLYATAMIARFRPGDPRVLWASAGHPPAVVRDVHGAVRVLDAKPGVMLGIPLPCVYPDHRADLPADSTLVLYTDGLVERRGEGIDTGIGRLCQALEAVSTSELEQDPDAAADAVLKPLLHDSERADDVCLLLCHTMKPPAPNRPTGAARSPVHHEPPGNRPSRGSVEVTWREGECRERT